LGIEAVNRQSLTAGKSLR